MSTSSAFSTCMYACALVGAYKVAASLLSGMRSFARHYLRKGFSLHERYAKGHGASWAVVTGGSDGIGLEICHQLAARGFNICIVSRNAAKIDGRLAELVAAHPTIATRAVVVDFGRLFKISDYQERIGAALQDIDVAMLFLNAGFVRVGSFTDITAQEIEQSVMINVMQPIYTAKALVDQMLSRKHLSAIVITSSGLGSMAIPGCVDYSCGKSFATLLGEGLNYELAGKIDCMAWQSGKVATKMNGATADGSHCVTPKQAVAGMLNDLGRESLTYGCVAHSKSMFMVSLLPQSIIKRKFFAGFKEERLKQIEMVRKSE